MKRISRSNQTISFSSSHDEQKRKDSLILSKGEGNKNPTHAHKTRLHVIDHGHDPIPPIQYHDFEGHIHIILTAAFQSK